MNTSAPPPPPGFVLVEQQNAPPPPPPGFQINGQPAEPTLVDRIMSGFVDPAMGYAAAAGDGFREGVANLLGAPVDLINASPMLLNILPGEQGFGPFTDRPFGGSASIDAGLRGATPFTDPVIPNYEPQGAGQRIVNRLFNEVGANTIPIAGALTAAGRMGVQGARAMGGPIGNFVESMAVNPVATTAKELQYAGGAGIGAGALREAFSDGDPNTTTSGEALADLVGAFGGMAGVGLVRGGASAVSDAFSALSGRGGSRVVNDAVAGELATRAGAPRTPAGVPDTSGLAEALATAGRRVSELIPGFKPSTADVLQDPKLAALEYTRQSGPNSGMFVERRMANTQAAADAIDEMAPTATPGAFRETLSANRDAQLLESETQAYLARTKFDSAVANLQAVQSGEARGQTIRGALDEALSAARGVERTAWSAVQGEGDGKQLAAAIGSVTDELTLAERDAVGDLGSTLAIPARLLPDDETAKAAADVAINVSEVTGMRSALTTAARQAEAAGDPNKARIIGLYVDAIDGFLAKISDTADALDAARAVSRDLNDRFTRRGSPVADTLATRPSGGPVVPDSRVAPAFIQPNEGQASVIDNVLRETGPTTRAAEARAALRDQILADVKDKGLLDRPDELRAYLDQYGQVFGKFPDLKRDLGTSAGLRETLAGAEKAQVETARRLGGADDQKGTSQVARYLQFGDEKAVDAMSGVVNAKDPAAAADELIAFVGNDPQAIEGAKSAFWQLMTREARSKGATTGTASGTQPWRPASLYNFVTAPKNAAVMERLYANDPEHLQRIRDIADELRRVDIRTTAKAPNTSGTAQALGGSKVLPSTETLGAYAFAYQRGQVGLPFIATRLVSTIARRAMLKGRTAEFETLLDQALLNPDVAEKLLRENNPANIEALTRAAKTALGVRSAWVDDLLNGDEPARPEQDMVDVIMGSGQ